MAEINNSLAASIQPLDIGKTLLTAGQINALKTKSALEEAETAQTQQNTLYNQFLQNRPGANGLRPGEENTLADAAGKRAGLAGSIGNAMVGAKTPEARQQVLQMAKDRGVPFTSETEQHMINAPQSAWDQYAKRMQAAGMSSSTNIEQTGVPAGNTARERGKYEPYAVPENTPIISQTEAATGGRKPIKSSAAIIGDDEAVQKGLYSPTPDQIKRGIKGPTNPLPAPNVVKNPDGSISSSVTPETKATQASLGEDYAGYKESAKNAAMTKYLLRNMQDDADRISTGKGATFTNTAKQWIQAAQSLPGVGDAVKKITGDISDPIAAFEAIQKNAGQLTRATLKDVDGKAASEYRMIQSQLPNAEMSPRGLKLVAAQMTAPEDFKQAKLQIADRWKAANNGSLAGFESDWNKNISPTTFLFARLPGQERDALIKNLNKTDQGKATLARIKEQAAWAHKNQLDEFID